MISIVAAKTDDHLLIADIGRVSVEASHRNSSSEEIMNEYLQTNYNYDTIKNELLDLQNIYHISYYDAQPAGFSKIVLNASHPAIKVENVAKLDRIYLLKEFHGLGIGRELLHFNIELAKKNAQSGMWLYSWVGNQNAIDFYIKAGFTIIGTYNFHVAKSHYDLSYQMLLNFAQR